jgi:Reverse transcriptase (RNA-dependent DNA polymerase)
MYSFYARKLLAFRPTGSTTSAIISLLNHRTNMLVNNPYVVVIAIDFTKAFDTVRQATLIEKLAMLNLPDNVCNWFNSFFNHRSHCTDYNGERSSSLEITASIVQGSVMGPASYVVTAADLHPVTPGNEMCKYADDTYIIIPTSNIDSRVAELRNVETWACANNLKLNYNKTTEIIFYNRRSKRAFQKPTEIAGIARVTSIKVLGVTITGSLSMSNHVQNVLSSCSQTLYALRTLRAHGLPTPALQTVFSSVVLAKITYAASAWCGFIAQTDKRRIDSFIKRSKRAGLCSGDIADFDELCQACDCKLFNAITSDIRHVLFSLLPHKSIASECHNLRLRQHDFELPDRLNYLTDCNFINRVLYSLLK